MAEAIESQLIACVSSYLQIIDYFSMSTAQYNYNNNDEQSATVSSFLEARINIFSALTSLNFLLSEAEDANQSLLVVGRVCLAPRLVDAVYDVCLVSKVVHDDTSGSVSGVVIHWLYPRNVYELRSSGMAISVATGSLDGGDCSGAGGLRLYTQTHHSERITALRNLMVGEELMVSAQNLLLVLLFTVHACTLPLLTTATLCVLGDKWLSLRLLFARSVESEISLWAIRFRA